MSDTERELLARKRLDEITRIGKQAVADAQQRNRQAGVPNVYYINGLLQYETPSGALSTNDPWIELTIE